MVIGERIRALRKAKHFTQQDIQDRTGLIRFALSRLEHGHVVPSLRTLEKIAGALEIPLYKLFYEGKERPKPLRIPPPGYTEKLWGYRGKSVRKLARLRRALDRMSVRNRRLLLKLAREIVRRNQP